MFFSFATQELISLASQDGSGIALPRASAACPGATVAAHCWTAGACAATAARSAATAAAVGDGAADAVIAGPAPDPAEGAETAEDAQPAHRAITTAHTGITRCFFITAHPFGHATRAASRGAPLR
ncbi:MAG TPA: hypothetical protein VH478_05455 [Trebonia sp.]|nr:hypothetical protein [Trebonia sp.]